ncbi:MAG TPA: D-mannonate epimerase [Verrucomicrobiota bacterium]|jgi:nickel-dependent lactate racemase|nr:D-mannonate epimerase [Verrucomicrobiota bacterium]HRT10320.1 D-mannonate epimerase [Candidatus Paceibacterota bacterium]HRT58272.1 D-mannonate epimerase [Candidatus Paceibacterota bacterium]
MLYFERGSATDKLTPDDLRAGFAQAMDRLGARRRVLAIPPDFTRFHSQAGILTRIAWDYFGDRLVDVLPALGTHSPMSPAQIGEMFAGVPPSLFRVHNWRTGVTTVGEVPAAFVREASNGAVDFPWPAQLANLIWTGRHDLILSIGQVVPHEVIGMANYNKNIFVGTGGAEGINKSHFVGAAYGMERMMGRADTPVRRILNYAGEKFISHLPIVYVHTVVSRDAGGQLRVRGLFIGDDASAFTKAADLSLQVNFEMLEEPLHKVVVYLDPGEFKSTWLGNKSIYRTRMAMADGGDLLVLAPGLKEFGEDPEIDRLIRKYGYRGTPATLAAVRANGELRDNLSAAAHLIHGSSEGRFNITYCPGHLTRAEIEGVGFAYADLAAMSRRYDPKLLKDGWNTLPDGERIFFISNPALGLWAWRKRFEN